MITVLGRLFCFCMSPRLAGVVGIEPTTEWLTVTWSTADLHANTYHKLVRPQGLEPWTYWLKASYSTIELWSQKLHNKKVAAAKVPPSFAFRGISLYNYCKGPTALCSSVGLLYRNCCKNWWTQGNSNPYSIRERDVSWPLDDGSRNGAGYSSSVTMCFGVTVSAATKFR